MKSGVTPDAAISARACIPQPVRTKIPLLPAAWPAWMSMSRSPTTNERCRSIAYSASALWSIPGNGFLHSHTIL